MDIWPTPLFQRLGFFEQLLAWPHSSATTSSKSPNAKTWKPRDHKSSLSLTISIAHRRQILTSFIQGRIPKRLWNGLNHYPSTTSPPLKLPIRWPKVRLMHEHSTLPSPSFLTLTTTTASHSESTSYRVPSSTATLSFHAIYFQKVRTVGRTLSCEQSFSTTDLFPTKLHCS